MAQYFDKARRIAGPAEHIVAINGCCYGKTPKSVQTGNYLKLCGQDFWHLISGEPLLYQEIIEPLGFEARQRNDEFDMAFTCLHTRLSTEFAQSFCRADGAIDWRKIVAMNSGSTRQGHTMP